MLMFSKYMLCLGIAVTIFGCQKTTDNKQLMYEEAAKHKTDFKHVALDNSVDFICNMNLSLGIADTAHHNGKTYGFCSKSCKANFVATPESYTTK